MIIENVQILMGDGVFRRGSVEFEDVIKKIDVYETVNASAGPYLIPGLIDIHTHGALGADHSDHPATMGQEMSRFYARNGVTSYLATTLTAPMEMIEGAIVKKYPDIKLPEPEERPAPQPQQRRKPQPQQQRGVKV